MATHTQNPTTASTTQFSRETGFGAVMPFNAICEPGCYIANWTGHLLRVPSDVIGNGGAPMLNIVGAEQLFVTKLSCDPFIPVTKARMLACSCDLNVNF